MIKYGKILFSKTHSNTVVGKKKRTTLILNTRTSQALTRAGIPRSQWNAVDRTGVDLYEEMLSGQLSRNKLTSEGISTVRQSGGQ